MDSQNPTEDDIIELMNTIEEKDSEIKYLEGKINDLEQDVERLERERQDI